MKDKTAVFSPLKLIKSNKFRCLMLQLLCNLFVKTSSILMIEDCPISIEACRPVGKQSVECRNSSDSPDFASPHCLV